MKYFILFYEFDMIFFFLSDVDIH